MNTETTYIAQDERVIDFDDALARAWSKIRRAAKDGTDINKRKADGSARRYTTLAAVDEAIRDALTAEGFTYPQPPSTRVDDRGVWIVIHTQIRRKGVAFVPEPYALLVQGGIMKGGEGFKPPTAQDMGSALTYARRYALTSVFGVCPDEDDDGHGASQRPESKPDPLWERYVAARAAAAKHLRATEQQAHQRILAVAEVTHGGDPSDPEVKRMIEVAEAMLLTDRAPTPSEQTEPTKARGKGKGSKAAAKPEDAPLEPAETNAVKSARAMADSARKAYADECREQGVAERPWLDIAAKAIGKPWSVEKGSHSADDYLRLATAYEAEIDRVRRGETAA